MVSTWLAALLTASVFVCSLGAKFARAANDIRVLVDGSPVVSDTPAVNRDGRVYLPLRAIAEALGGQVAWDEASKTAIVDQGGQQIRMTIGKQSYQIDGREYTMDAAAFIADTGRVMVPVRYLAEALGLDVAWDGAAQEVHLARLVPSVANTVGNTPGNIVNSGYAAAQGEWVFFTNYADGWKLYRTKVDGNSAVKVADIPWVNHINVVGDWVYFLGEGQHHGLEGIYRTRLNGLGTVMIHEGEITQMAVVGPWIYYTEGVEDGRLYRMRVDGTDRKLMTDLHFCRCFSIVGESIYFQSWNEDGSPNIGHDCIWRIDLDGSNQRKLADDGGTKLLATDSWLLFEHVDNWSERRFSWRTLQPDGSGLRVLRTGSRREWINYVAGWLYYVDGDYQGGPLYKMRLDTGEQVLVCSDHCTRVNVVGDWVLYQRGYGSAVLCRVRTDGTQGASLIGGVWVQEQ